MIIILEKDIVDHLVKYWDGYFGYNEMLYSEKPVKFHSTEYKATSNWRCDILAYIEIPNYNNKDKIFKQPIYTEVKYNNNARDLINELTRGLEYINTRGSDAFPRSLCVIADNTLDKVTIDFIKNNNILFYQFSIKDNDFKTFKIWKVNEDL